VAGAQQRDLGLDVGKLFAAIFEVDLGWMSGLVLHWRGCAYVFDCDNLARSSVDRFVHLPKAPTYDYVS
jgi:hypothetical protein